ncbi:MULTISPECIES: hypothetical protein [unclassified Stenotrophomonas]|uniref:hypothetical protein n=1 Tax=unclassified Stenotrophomonas TaxID=196198 RepID=UPI0021187B8E|nr:MULTISPECIES: hypothetical protein [unclassified Stenotrophomonas]
MTALHNRGGTGAAADADGRGVSRARIKNMLGARCLALLICVLMLAGCNTPTDPARAMQGGCSPSTFPFLPVDASVEGRITRCDGGDDWTGRIQTQPYPAGTRHIDVMLTGYPSVHGINLSAVGQSGRTAPILSLPTPRESWQRVNLTIPEDVSREAFSVVLEDHATGMYGWAGLGASTVTLADTFKQGLLPLLLAVLLGNAWLTVLSFCLPRVGTPRERALTGLLAAGCIWLLVFIAFVGSAALGSVVSAVAVLLPFAWALRTGRRPGRTFGELAGIQKELLPVLLLALLVLWIGLFPFHGNGMPNAEGASRWRPLPIDAWLPMLFGDMLAQGRLDVPMIGDWLSSDRPPLQAGLYLMVRDTWPQAHGLVYQGISTWAQTLFLLPLAALLDRFAGRSVRTLTLFALCLSALVLVNALFVWPKLLAAAFCLIYYGALFPAGGMPRRWGQAGIAAAMAMLSHGGALFFLAGASLMQLAWYRRAGLVMLTRTGAVALAGYLPWIAYQRFIDPPGDRLIKWHFAGKVPPGTESALHALVDAYSHLTPSQWLHARLQDIMIITRGALSAPVDALSVMVNNSASATASFIEVSFFHLFYSMWFASPLLLPPCLAVLYWRSRARGVRDPALTELLKILATVLLVLVFWMVAMFDAGATSIHQGAYAGGLLMQAAILVALARTSKVLFYVVGLASIAVALRAYALDRAFLPGMQIGYLVGTVALCGGLLAALWRTASPYSPPLHAPHTAAEVERPPRSLHAQTGTELEHAGT